MWIRWNSGSNSETGRKCPSHLSCLQATLAAELCHLCSHTLLTVPSPFQVKSQAPALWSHELRWWAIHIMEEKHFPCFCFPPSVLWCRGLFLRLSHLLTDCSFESLQHLAGLSQLERGVGCRQNHHAVQNDFTASCTSSALILFQMFLSNKMNVNNYKCSDKMWHTQHHRNQAQLSKRGAVLVLFENSRKKMGGGEL